MSINIIAQQPPQQIVPGSIAHRQEQQSSQFNYMYSNIFLMKSSLVMVAGALLAGSGEYFMYDSDNHDTTSKKLAAFATAAGVNVLCVSCGGCFAYWQERCCDTKHKIE